MASASLRRAAVPVALVGLVMSGAPLVTGTAAAATPPPAFQPTASTPIAGGSVMYGNDTITATFDQPVTGTANSMKVYERNTDGTRGYQLPGTVTATCSSLSGPGKSISWKPSSTLVVAEYEVVVNASGTKSSSDCTADPTRPATADYDYYVVGPVKPSGLNVPLVNNQNVKAAPFSGTLAPGLTVTVKVSGKNANDPTNQIPASASGSTTVPACGTSSCPFTVPVDISGLKDTSAAPITWTAQSSDPVNTSATPPAAVTGPSFTKDTTAPGRPSLASAPTLPAHSTTLTVPKATPASGDTDVVSYVITVSDPDGHSLSVPVTAAGDHTMPQQTVDVSGLDDGKLTVLVQAKDAAGNIGNSAQDSGGNDYTVTKNTGLVPNLTTSFVSTAARDVSLAEAATHGVQTPKSIDVEFTQPIKSSYNNANDASPSNPNGTHNWSAQLTTPEGNKLMDLVMKASSTGRGAILTPPTGSAFPTSGAFGIALTVFSQNLCPNVQFNQTDNCQSFSDQVKTGSGNTGSNLQITVDNTPPTINFDATNPITGANLQTASLAGTVDSDVSAVQLTLTSSNAPNRPRIASLPTSTSNGTTTFSSSPLPLSGMVDGTLTIVAKATDAAGNSATLSKDVVLRALALTIVPGDGKLLVTWTKPTLTNNDQPNYTLYYRDQSVANAPVQTLTPASTATSQVLGGLTNGHDYGVALTAVDSAGSGPVAVGDAVPRGGATLTMSAPSRLTYSRSFTLTGKLTHGKTGISGASITITPYYGSKAATPLHVKTTSTGTYAVKVRPLKTVTYVATFAGDAAYTPATAKRRVGLRVLISITKASGTRVQGSVAPNMKGRIVTIFERVNKKNKKVGTAKLTSKSTWTFTHRWSAGTHYVFASFASQNGYYGNTSSKVKIVR